MENTQKIIDEMKSSFDKLMQMNNDIISKLPIEHQQKVLPIQMDINTILESVKSGDITKINEISKKYGCSNN